MTLSADNAGSQSSTASAEREFSAGRRALVEATRELASRRTRVAAILTALMIAVYFGFILTVAYNPQLLGSQIQRGLSLGIVLGALVIVVAWFLTYAYVTWANRVYDPGLALLRERWREADIADAAAASLSERAPTGEPKT